MEQWNWWLLTALFALQAFYDSFYRLPQFRQKLHDATEDRDRHREDLAELQLRFDRLDAEHLETLEQLYRIKDPEYYAALDAGDAQALYEIDKKRGLV